VHERLRADARTRSSLENVRDHRVRAAPMPMMSCN
jgi:hypothetical protein